MQDKSAPVSFDNTEFAFKYKTDKELRKARLLFALMGQPALVQVGTRLTPWAIKNKLPIKGMVRNTIFKQFVGGETLEETAKVAQKLGQYNVKVILDYGVEGGEDGDREYDHAADEFIKVIDYAATQPNIPFMSVKVTGFSRFSLLEKIDREMNRATGTLIKRYLYVLEQLNKEEKKNGTGCVYGCCVFANGLLRKMWAC